MLMHIYIYCILEMDPFPSLPPLFHVLCDLWYLFIIHFSNNLAGLFDHILCCCYHCLFTVCTDILLYIVSSLSHCLSPSLSLSLPLSPSFSLPSPPPHPSNGLTIDSQSSDLHVIVRHYMYMCFACVSITGCIS